MEKRCSKCKEKKDLSFFGVKKHSNDGYNHYCKKCENERGRIKYTVPKYKESRKYYTIEKLYGLTKNTYLSMLHEQKNMCKICDCELKNDKKTHVDHCHKTGKVRGLLCSDCNGILGKVNDNIFILMKCIDYLKS
jgi:hypothetical protein